MHNFHWSWLYAWFDYRDSVDLHALLNHAYHAKNAEHCADHLGFHKALCVLMGWNYSVAPVFKTAYQALSTAAAEANQGDLILWPPTVIIENTYYKSKNDGQKDVMSNKELESKLRGIPSMLAVTVFLVVLNLWLINILIIRALDILPSLNSFGVMNRLQIVLTKTLLIAFFFKNRPLLIVSLKIWQSTQAFCRIEMKNKVEKCIG